MVLSTASNVDKIVCLRDSIISTLHICPENITSVLGALETSTALSPQFASQIRNYSKPYNVHVAVM